MACIGQELVLVVNLEIVLVGRGESAEVESGVSHLVDEARSEVAGSHAEVAAVDYFIEECTLVGLVESSLGSGVAILGALAGSYVDGVADTYEFLEGGRYDFEVVGSG